MRQPLVILLLVTALTTASPNWRPVVLMHGLLSDAGDLVEAQGWIENDFPVCKL